MDGRLLAEQLLSVARLAGASPAGRAHAALLGLLSVTAGTEDGAQLCRRMLRTAIDRDDEGRSRRAAHALGKLAQSLTSASEHVEYLAEVVEGE